MDIKISERGRYILNHPDLADKVMNSITNEKAKLMQGESVKVTGKVTVKLAKSVDYTTTCPPDKR